MSTLDWSQDGTEGFNQLVVKAACPESHYYRAWMMDGEYVVYESTKDNNAELGRGETLEGAYARARQHSIVAAWEQSDRVEAAAVVELAKIKGAAPSPFKYEQDQRVRVTYKFDNPTQVTFGCTGQYGTIRWVAPDYIHVHMEHTGKIVQFLRGELELVPNKEIPLTPPIEDQFLRAKIGTQFWNGREAVEHDISSMARELLELRKLVRTQPRWVDAKDRLPELLDPGKHDSIPYLCLDVSGHRCLCYLLHSSHGRRWSGNYEVAVAYWLEGVPTSTEEAPAPAEELFYIQDGSYAGDSVSWWRLNSCGYTFDLGTAMRVPREEALKIVNLRGTDIAWPCDVIDATTQRHFSMEDLRGKESASLTARADHPGKATGTL